ncbi:MAG: protein kinase [Anaerolineaceae bacterium]|jgi:serine/threonine-protein kinase|nr:protein kinase [Anaerolineaceae bacterium]
MEMPSLLNDRYQLQETLGTGGMAVVYKARDLMLERNVAVKVLREDFSKDPAFRERFRQEARAAANLSHPNIVTVHDFGLDQGHLFIVMEYMPGTDLKTLVKQKERFPVSEALELMVQACGGVGYAHRAGLVHCDVKPHNMLVTPEGRLKVTDFGIARALASISPDELSDVVWGSPHYFSPEQAGGRPPSPASDVYSLGVILYEMITGRLPFIASDSAELARMHREDKPLAPRYYNNSIPSALEEIILKVLSKEPSSRYRTADQLGRLLLGLYDSNPESSQNKAFVHDTFQGARLSQSSINGEKEQFTPPQTLLKPDPIAVQPKNPIEKPQTETFAAPLVEDTDDYYFEEDWEEEDQIDWKTWALGILASLLLIGLIPFWFYIYIILKP